MCHVSASAGGSAYPQFTTAMPQANGAWVPQAPGTPVLRFLGAVWW